MNSWRFSYSPKNRCKSLGDDIEGLYRSRLEKFILYQKKDTLTEMFETAESWGVNFTYHSQVKKTAKSLTNALTVVGLIRLIKKHTNCCDL